MCHYTHICFPRWVLWFCAYHIQWNRLHAAAELLHTICWELIYVYGRKGYIWWTFLFEVYKYFNSKVVCRNQKAFSYPYWWDSSRFNIDLVPFCRNEKFRQFMTPPQFNQRYQTTWPNQCIFTSSISRWRQVFIQKWWNN